MTLYKTSTTCGFVNDEKKKNQTWKKRTLQILLSVRISLLFRYCVWDHLTNNGFCLTTKSGLIEIP